MNAVHSTLRALAASILGVLLLLDVGSLAQAQNQSSKVVMASADQRSFAEPLALMYEAQANYATVQDYTCMLASRWKVNGKLGEENIVQMKVMTRPFSVHMRWLCPNNDAGQEAAFVEGKNDNKIRVKSKAISPLGFTSLDGADPRLPRNSRHTILDAEIGKLINRTIKTWEAERDLGKTRVLPPVNATNNKRDCIKVEAVRLEKHSGVYCYRTVIYLEKVSKMPIRLENYDWPQKGGSADGELLEVSSYVKIQVNTGLREMEFNK
jgi:Protein of unknown function (DUF1571)